MRRFMSAVITLWLGLLLVAIASASEMTVIIANTNTSACRVLEAGALDQAIPEGWVRVDLTKEQCEKALPAIQARDDYDPNIKSYVALLSCEKENNVRSLSYFGLGGKEVCKAAGLGWQGGRLIVTKGTVNEQDRQDYKPFAIAILAILLVILLLLILVKRKRSHV